MENQTLTQRYPEDPSEKKGIGEDRDEIRDDGSDDDIKTWAKTPARTSMRRR